MLINERNTRILLSESRKSHLFGQYDEYEIAAAIILESKTEIPYDIILTEGWFGDKIKQVGKFLNGYVGEPVKHGWGKWIPELYGQQTYKFWKRGELRKEAEAAFAKVLEDLEDESDEKWGQIWPEIKAQVAELEKGTTKNRWVGKTDDKGELTFPNMKQTEEFYQALFGSADWSECEKIFDALEKGENVPKEFTQGLFGKMATARIMLQNTVDAAAVEGAVTDGNDGAKEIIANANKKIKGMRDILQKYAQDVKEIYQTFENKEYLNSVVQTILLEADEEKSNPDGNKLSEEEAVKASEEIAKDLGISADRLNAMKGRQSPVRPLIAGLLLAIFGAIGMKIGTDQLNASIEAYEKMLKAKDMELNDALKAIKNRVVPNDFVTNIDVDNGYTQLVQQVNNSTSPLADMSADALQNMNISDFQQHAESLGFGEGFWSKSGANGADSFKMLKSLISENPSMSVKEFFAQSGKLATKMSGQTLKSPFGLKKGIGQLMIKGGKAALSKATKTAVTNGVGGFAISGIPVIYGGAVLPTALVGGIFAAGAGVGLLAVAAIRKFKGNRQKLLLACIDALSDIKGVRPSVHQTLDDEVQPLVDNPNIDLEPAPVKPDPNSPGPNMSPVTPGKEDDDVDPDGIKGCEQDVFGLTQFMKKYDKDSDFTNKPGDGRPKKMSTMFDGPKLDKKFKKLSADALQKDLNATAKKYNDLLNAKIFTVSEDPEEIKAAAEKPIVSSHRREGEMLSERWAKIAGIK